MSEEVNGPSSPEHEFRVKHEIDKNLADSMRGSISDIFNSACRYGYGFASTYGFDQPNDGSVVENIQLKFESPTLSDVIIEDDGVNPQRPDFVFGLDRKNMYKAKLTAHRIGQTEERIEYIELEVPAAKTNGHGEQMIILEGLADDPTRETYAYENFDFESIAAELANASSVMRSKEYWNHTDKA
jgi:hypothetical protein